MENLGIQLSRNYGNFELLLTAWFVSELVPNSVLSSIEPILRPNMGVLDVIHSRIDGSGFPVIRIFNSLYGVLMPKSHSAVRILITSVFFEMEDITSH